MFTDLVAFHVAGKYEPKSVNLTSSFSSVLALHSDVCATNK